MAMTTTWQCPKCGSQVVSDQQPDTQGCTGGQPASSDQGTPIDHAWQPATGDQSGQQAPPQGPTS